MDDLDSAVIEGQESSIFQSNLPLETKIDRARMELLDLSARNRLLNVPRFSKSAKTIDVVDEKTAEIFRLLVTEGKTLTFLPGAKDRGEAAATDAVDNDDDLAQLALPEDNDRDENGLLKRHGDTRLQTRMTPNGLQKRLLDLYFDARTLEEEQGVNILFLALGTLKWIDPNNAENIRYAPLILVPVSLERGTAADRFKLKVRPEDFAFNLSLEAFLERVHTITMPTFESSDEFDPTAYIEEVRTSVASKPGWDVNPDDIILGFFSFAKFLMYRDLDPALWPTGGKFIDQPLIRSLLADGFPAVEEMISEDANVDAYVSPAEMLHIVDSDSSQTVAIHEVRHGRDLVIQGPPGTGKSQTIANIIASAIADGKTVLFVAEKMAALDVVKRRLDNAGVGDACLELHSSKANKRAVLEQLRRTWELGAPNGAASATLNARLTEARDRLNAHPVRLHKQYAPYDLSPYQVIGQLTRLRQQGQAPTELVLIGAPEWSVDHRHEIVSLIGDLAARVTDIGVPAQHPWFGVGLDAILPTDLERLVARLSSLRDDVDALRQKLEAIATTMRLPVPETIQQFELHAKLAARIATAPPLTPKALGSAAWSESRPAIGQALHAGRKLFDIVAQLTGVATQKSWTTPTDPIIAAFEKLPPAFAPEGFEMLDRLTVLMPKLNEEGAKLAAVLGLTFSLTTLSSADQLAATGERISVAPDASPEAFAATVWDRGIDQAGDLADAVATIETVKAALAGKIADPAWDMDLAAARTALASHGASALKFLNGDYRKADSLLKSVFQAEGLSLQQKIELLDQLGKGQGARRLIRDGDAFGRAAFGSDWRGERSNATPLLDLVTWMRSLRGLGAEARLIASRLPDRAQIGERSRMLKTLLEDARRTLAALWLQLGDRAGSIFDGAVGAETIDIPSGLVAARWLSDANVAFSEIISKAPPTAGERVALLAMIKEGQATWADLSKVDPIGREAFGDAWKGYTSDWDVLDAAATWIDANPSIRTVAASVPDRQALSEDARKASVEAGALTSRVTEIMAALKSSRRVLFAKETPDEVPLESLRDRLSLWLDNDEQLSKWVAYKNRANAAQAFGIGDLSARMEQGSVAPIQAIPRFEMAYYEAILASQIAADPAIGRFDGQLHSQLAGEFAELDRERIAVSRLEVVQAHHRRIPPSGGGVGPIGVLKAEMARRRGHMPIRQLMHRAAPAIQALKPVLMMSPLSVAQFLPPGELTFDLLVMDEASQIQPVDALGAIARAKQVIVGDERQLPPTKFFAKMTASQPEDDDGEGAQVADIESILGLFSARGLPQRMLRWHYRSRHQSLIAVSNSQFYENKLFIVPSPYTAEAGMGLAFHLVPNGVFDDGINAVEAKVVAEAIIRHAKESPEVSLGVVTFSVKQRREIQDQVEILRRMNPDCEEFFHAHPSEPFFIKNLENVQGDERDAIIISVGYAKGPQGGRPSMYFGPLSTEGGERRLNVLISRAKRRCEVYASITDEDMDLERGKGKGVFAFKLFLHYARTGRLSVSQRTDRSVDSVFEEQVADALQARNYQVHPQVGIAGFFIDLAIADPERPGRYVLGIECDGASYHDARSARDRDRLRQAVLEDHGWIIHRIWSTDWFQRPKAELEKVIAAIERAKVELDAELQKGTAFGRAVPVEVVTVERADVTEIGLVSVDTASHDTKPYVEAKVMPLLNYELHDTPLVQLAGLVEAVVMVEGPVHRDEVVVRLRSAWGLMRAGGRIDGAVGHAIDFAMSGGKIQQEGQFLSIPGASAVLRDRSSVVSLTLRRPEMLPPAEIDAGVLAILAENFGATEEEAVQAISRSLGFKATSSQLRDVIAERLTSLTERGLVRQQGPVLVVADAEPAKPPTSSSARTAEFEGSDETAHGAVVRR